MLTSEGNSQGTTTCQKHTIRVGPNFSAEPTDPTQILNRGPSLPEFEKKKKKKKNEDIWSRIGVENRVES